MQHNARSMRPFIGAKDYERSRAFYRDLGFAETALSPTLCVFQSGAQAFYLQNYYVKDWVDNTMLFLEVDSVDRFWQELTALNLEEKYPEVRLTPARTEAWGKECFIHDPCGILWHIGEFF